MEYPLCTERPVTSRASLLFAQTSLIAFVKGTYDIGVNARTVCSSGGRIGQTGMVIWIYMRRAIEVVTSTFNWQEIENIASI